MIRLLHGENDFELRRRLQQIRREFDAPSERFDAQALSNEQLADIFAGQTLFDIKRLIVLDDPSGCAELWNNLEAWSKRLSSDTELVLIEPKIDKRTAAYKWLKKNATVEAFMPLEDRDIAKVLAWMEAYASAHSVSLTSTQAKRIIARAGVNQSALADALDKLTLAGEVTNEWIDAVVEQSPVESVFSLFETALSGDVNRLSEIIADLRRAEDPYKVLGLINSQVIQLAILAESGGDITKVAADTGAKSSYPLQKMAPYARRLTKDQIKELLDVFTKTDSRLKSSDVNPWLLIETSLMKVSAI